MTHPLSLRLREQAAKLRFKPTPLAEVIPLLQLAADTIDLFEAGRLLERVTFPKDVTVKNGQSINVTRDRDGRVAAVSIQDEDRRTLRVLDPHEYIVETVSERGPT